MAMFNDLRSCPEIRDRYQRVGEGEDGKRPTPSEWLAKLKEAPPRWFRGYMEDIAPAPKPDGKPEPEADPADPADPPKVEGVPPTRAPDPNAGVHGDPNIRGRKLDDAGAARLSTREWADVRPKVAKDLMQDGQIRMSDALLKKLGGG